MEKTESRIQQEIIFYFRNNFCLEHHVPRSMIIHIPNEGPLSSLRSIGLYAGAADLLVVHREKIFFVEVKSDKGKQSEQQKKFQAHCEKSGLKYYLVRSLSDFRGIIEVV